jgi:hypothetical protein
LALWPEPEAKPVRIRRCPATVRVIFHSSQVDLHYCAPGNTSWIGWE